MSYTKTNWIDGETLVNAEKMNNIENGISSLETTTGDLNNLNTENKDNLVSAINENQNSIENLRIYSTDEQIIGRWIDDKPLYRKVITGTLPNSNTDWVTIYTNTNINEIINFGGIFYGDDGRQMPILFSQNNYEVNISFLGGEIAVYQNNTTWNGNNYKIILEYTKIID